MRVIRSLAALAVLLGGLVGVPLLLVRSGARLLQLFDAGSITPAALVDRLLAPDDGSLLAGLLLVVATVAWLVFTLSVLLEIVNLLARGRFRLRLPGFGGPQRWVAGLLLAVVAIGAVQGGSHAAADPPDHRPEQPSVTSAPVAVAPPAEAEDRATGPVTVRQHVHVVEAGDDLWSLADHYYGHGQQWRRIAAANPDRLSGGPDRLQVGTRLLVPGVDGVHRESVTVAAGDTLSSLAAAAYGDATAWPRIFRANQEVITDPDAIEVGMRLVVPAPPATSAPHPAKAPKRSAPADRSRQHGSTPTGSNRPVDPPSAPATQPTAPTRAPSRAPQASTRPATDSSHDERGLSVALPDRQVVGVAAGVGGLLATGLVAAALTRRRQQLAARPVGRRIPHPASATQGVEAAVGRRASRVTRDSLDLVLRAIGAHAATTGRLPELELVRLCADGIELVLTVADPRPPAGFTAQGRSWRLDRSGAGVLRAQPGLSGRACPYPLLVTLGSAESEPGHEILVDLERAGLLTVAGTETATAEAVELALGTEIALASWSEEVTVTVLGRHQALVESFDRPEVRHSSDVDALLDRLDHRHARRRSHLGGSTPPLLRLDSDLAASWAPEVVLVATELSDAQRTRLVELATAEPTTALAVVISADPAGPDRPGPGLALRLEPSGHPNRWPATLRPHDMTLDVQRLLPPVVDALADLLATTASTSTTPAPWWDATDDDDTTAPSPDDDEASDAPAPAARRAWASEEDPAVVRLRSSPAGPDPDHPAPVLHPTVLLLGPINLVGVSGTEPTRAAKQCVEYCTWLLEHPGATAPAMAAALAVAEGTRRSNMSRLRGWLGDDSDGEPHLPDAYSGRILLDPAVSSDWQRLQIHAAPSVNKASTAGLVAALELVRGAPLADAAPGQWHWAEELRTDMASAIRDVGVELGHRALGDQDLDLARWAANRALAAAPEDERLLGLRLEIEHLAGDRAEVERLVLRISRQARTLGVDLDPETVTLLQEVMEGRPRARVS